MDSDDDGDQHVDEELYFQLMVQEKVHLGDGITSTVIVKKDMKSFGTIISLRLLDFLNHFFGRDFTCVVSVDEVIKIGGTTSRRATLELCNSIIDLYKEQYLRDPTTEDLARLLSENKLRGFLGMIDSLDCMHWRWDACPIAWRGQYNGRYGYPTLILEAATSQDLWIWHAFFGMLGTNNNVTVLDHSLLFNKYMDGTAPPVEYEVNGTLYNLPYYLTDGIYPKHAFFMQAVRNPITAKEKAFIISQEACRKDIERAFGVLKQKWRIL
ncbi:uncharacterized protein LOC127256623 [Andrographis paniculata]|uniref:uncharacterized protein LOC127256623 n=1 Tax=Andrographis paniculata TaxID=175694 RepID=UPI0021E91A7E|nr:uncharacterized protein LOC127256623 [Andrographis paniculata]